MDSILKKVSFPDYEVFREEAMLRCGWSAEQFKNKKTGRTKITPAEIIVLNQLADELQAATIGA